MKSTEIDICDNCKRALIDNIELIPALIDRLKYMTSFEKVPVNYR